MELNFTHLAAFHAVAAVGNFSRAAQRILVSQPALSKQVRQLEQALGIELMIRNPRGVRLTEAGQLLFDYASRLFGLREEAVRSILQLRGLERGRLLIGASTTVGVYLLPQLIVKYRQRHPGVGVQLELLNSQHIQRRLLVHSLDVGFTEGFIQDDRLDVQIVRQDQLIPIAAPKHPLARKRKITAAMLCRQPFIVRETGSDSKSLVERTLASRGLKIEAVMSLGNTEAIKHAVAAGLGVAIVSALAVENEVKTRRLAKLNVPDLQIRRPLHRVLSRGPRSPALEAFTMLMGS